MEIDHYTFGCIAVSGHEYDADIIIFPDHVQKRWWRRQGHYLAQEDLKTIIAKAPQLLVIGTGYYGRMQVPDETLATLEAEGIEIRVSKTSEAVAVFNRLQRDCARIVAALHLTC